MGVIEEIRAGNKEAIKEVYKENVKDVYNFAKSITGNHETALEATKKTFVLLFNRIQKGENPTNIRLAALKIAYDEACAIVMPSTEAINSPYDKNDKNEEMSFKVSDEGAKKAEPANMGKPAENNAAKAPSGYANTPQNPAPQAQAQAPASDESLNRQPAKEPAKDTGKIQESENNKKEEKKKAKEKKAEGKNKKKEKKEEKSEKKQSRVYLGEDEDIDFEDASNDAPSYDNNSEEKRADAYSGYEDEEEGKKKHPVLSVILLILNIILVIILIWFVLGLLQNLGIIPDSINMGHNWFNTHIYTLF